MKTENSNEKDNKDSKKSEKKANNKKMNDSVKDKNQGGKIFKVLLPMIVVAFATLVFKNRKK